MKQIVAKSLMFLAVSFLGVQLAHACCLCDSGGSGYPYCAQTDFGAEICVGSGDPPFCQTYYNDCSTGCLPCYGGCCASLKDNKKGTCSTIKRMAWQEITPKRETDKSDHLKEFLAMADRGVFDGKIVYTHPDSTIAKGIMNLPVDHWKSFTQKVVMKGGQKEPALDPKLQSGAKPQTILEIETKTGHKLLIHLVEESTMTKWQNQPQSKSQKQAIEEKL
jgi:hypothetical protein